MKSDSEKVFELLEKAKEIAKEFKMLTNKPLGITGEIAEFEASRVLGYKLCDAARTPGFDMFDLENKKVQVKGRVVEDLKNIKGMVGSLKFNYPWDYAILVLLDKDYNVIEIYKKSRSQIKLFCSKTKSKARAKGALAISQFKSGAEKLYPTTNSLDK